MKTVDLNSDEPKRNLSIKKYDKIKSIEKTGYDIKYQEGFRRHIYRRDALKGGLNKSYVIFYANFCTKAMQIRLK